MRANRVPASSRHGGISRQFFIAIKLSTNKHTAPVSSFIAAIK